MKLHELLNILDNDMAFWINEECCALYDNKSQIDYEEYKGKEVVYVTQDSDGILTVEIN